jgi:hypothetical protein
VRARLAPPGAHVRLGGQHLSNHLAVSFVEVWPFTGPVEARDIDWDLRCSFNKAENECGGLQAASAGAPASMASAMIIGSHQKNRPPIKKCRFAVLRRALFICLSIGFTRTDRDPTMARSGV